MARVLALLVHAFTALLVVTGLLLLLTPIWIGFRVASLVLLLGLAWQVRPRTIELPEGTVVDRASAPLLFSLLDRVAQQTGTSVPARVVFDGSTRTSSGCGGGGTYVLVGLPLWLSAGPLTRVTLLGEQLGRLRAEAAVTDPVVVSGLQTLADWQYFFRPSNADARRRLDIDNSFFINPPPSPFSFVELFLPVFLFPFFAVVTGLRVALGRLARRDVERGIASGRQTADRVAGNAGPVLSAASAAAQHALVRMETASRVDPKADVWAMVRDDEAATSLLSDTDLAHLDDELRSLTSRTQDAIRVAARS